MLELMVGEIRRLNELASEQHFMVNRQQVRAIGLEDPFIEHQLESGRWLRVHDGVYRVDFRPLDQMGQLMAAVLACGPGALVLIEPHFSYGVSMGSQRHPSRSRCPSTTTLFLAA